ncbi:MAG: RNA polymerase sigma factor SigX [Candidatus Giovannonibacteria bacterium GW2011_GWA2_44_13b]|uniref:RNA polymerase sigma factor SigX n=2 Tax=Candidatus Giovannoniibacteriota TaxID=1752738 RepID=A0A0G1K2C0_9BACT|nr:MAG: RNA polymerase sigma factor SigX [Candidatus Giovannonibacteria bacterium GW2011_GWA2_44_13b]OGF82092.1 MAG: hypothetical protein A2924_03095 [Candidatus Giovannonibacteria bacterium RIFCSPLOWO2_01_FULL_44_16]
MEFIKSYDAYADALFRHCYFRLYDRELAKDLVQSTYMKVWEYIASGKEVKNMRAFLYKVAHNMIIDEFRKNKGPTLSIDELKEKGIEPQDGLFEKLKSGAEVKNLLDIFNKLEPAHREVVIMRYVDELTPKEIAAITGESENVISVRLHRAMARAKEIIIK